MDLFDVDACAVQQLGYEGLFVKLIEQLQEREEARLEAKLGWLVPNVIAMMICTGITHSRK